MVTILNRWRISRRIARLERQLTNIIAEDHQARDVAGETAQHIPDLMVENARLIAHLRFEIAGLKFSDER